MSTIILWGPARSRQRDESACAACLQVYLGQLARRQTLPTALRLPLGAAQSPCVPPLNNARRTVDTPRNTACGCLAAASELLCVFLCCCCCFFFAFHLRPQRCTARLLFVFFSLFTSLSLSLSWRLTRALLFSSSLTLFRFRVRMHAYARLCVSLGNSIYSVMTVGKFFLTAPWFSVAINYAGDNFIWAASLCWRSNRA